ncbi:hypothetical protein AUJ42_00985 [Candidatus Collierbacteria bacterium CG1_02_44_10]|uniref:Uncharacterized protein n=2 Tax=Candidatus Collieribacteriota TaxID=1752725 RepID=A0A1J4RXW9_9BACT|nr:hypothetical protein [bacterium]OIN92027.1 MAG: hypothetical protein AUJ42_00985 [Candidatus Collierbacteria bacterium CG1_02_44_10]
MFKLISTIYAADIPLGSEVGGVGPFQTGISGAVQTGLGTFLSNIITTITVVGSLAFVIFFTLGGLEWITAGGDKAKVSSAQTQMTQATIGLIAIVASYFIIGIVGAVLGLDILRPFKTLFPN